MSTEMRVTRSMTRALAQAAPKKQQPKKEKQVSRVEVPKKQHPIVEFITEEELESRNIKEHRYINLIRATGYDNMLRHHPHSFDENDIPKHIAEKRIYAVVPDGYRWDSERIYFGGDCYYIEECFDLEVITEEEFNTRKLTEKQYVYLVNTEDRTVSINTKYTKYIHEEIKDYIAQNQVYAIAPNGHEWYKRGTYSYTLYKSLY